MFFTGLIFFLVYTVLATGSVPGFRIDRTGAALIGATLMIVVGSITFEQAYQAIDFIWNDGGCCWLLLTL